MTAEQFMHIGRMNVATAKRISQLKLYYSLLSISSRLNKRATAIVYCRKTSNSGTCNNVVYLKIKYAFTLKNCGQTVSLGLFFEFFKYPENTLSRVFTFSCKTVIVQLLII